MAYGKAGVAFLWWPGMPYADADALLAALILERASLDDEVIGAMEIGGIDREMAMNAMSMSGCGAIGLLP